MMRFAAVLRIRSDKASSLTARARIKAPAIEAKAMRASS